LLIFTAGSFAGRFGGVGRAPTRLSEYGNVVKMSKTNSIVDFLEAGLRAEGVRQKAIASNIANLETPGYRRLGIKFEEMLTQALDSGGSVNLSEIEPEIHEPRETMIKSNGNDVNLEVEVGEMVKNSLRHKAFIRLLGKKYQQMELAINTDK
jgi:flagellar basal-body rod protein FlgB